MSKPVDLSIPFPLSTGELARIYVPSKMSIYDARRLKRMISALYINGLTEVNPTKEGRDE